MTSFLLRFNDAVPNGEYDHVLTWTKPGVCDFKTTLGPNLDDLGQVHSANIDFVRLAALATAADRTVLRERGGSDWNSRDFELTVPVSNPDAWNAEADAVSSMLGFLSGDGWHLAFVTQPPPPSERLVADAAIDPVERTVLFSGGADSACGAVLSAASLPPEGRHRLVSHYSATPVAGLQTRVWNELSSVCPNVHHDRAVFEFTRYMKRTDGRRVRGEGSSRTRSLMFLALGLAVAGSADCGLWMPENGYASLNPPMNAGRRGALSTRTTHPRFLTSLSTILGRLGAHNRIANPFEWATKGEMFRLVADTVGDGPAARLLSATNSCAHLDARFVGVAAATSCGVCFGCLVRRAAFKAAEIEDRTEYLCEDTRPAVKKFVSTKDIREEMRVFAHSGVDSAMIATLGLPDGYSPDAAAELCARGVGELRMLLP